MGGVEYFQPLLKQVRWKVADVLLTGRQSGNGGWISTLQGPYASQAIVRAVQVPAGRAAQMGTAFGVVLDRLAQLAEPGIVPFVWAQLSALEVGFLTESRPPVHQHAPGAGLGWDLLQLLGIIQILRHCGAEVKQLCPNWLVWDVGALPRLADLRWIVSGAQTAAGYWTHPSLLRGLGSPGPGASHLVDTAVWSAIQLALARNPGGPGAAQLTQLLDTSCSGLQVLAVVFRVIGLPEIADGEPADAGSPSRIELPQWNYSPSSASKSPASRRRFTSAR